jgi:hypothetical protein
MCTPTQFGHDLFRILLYRNDATELLLENSRDGLGLPAVSVPSHTRVAEAVTAAIKTSWGLETYCLFTLPSATPSGPTMRQAVLETCRYGASSPARMRWFPVGPRSVGEFEDPADFAAIHNTLTTLEQYRRGELPGVFGKSGWLRMVTEWVEEQAAAADLCLTGKFGQLNASPTFSLIRFETDGPALWFKAVGEPNLHEYRITLKLASLFPEFLPRILGTQPEWNAWLALESEGCQLDANSTNKAWATAADSLALLQISSFGRRFELVNAGCKDLRPCCLLDIAHPFLEAMTEFMERQTRISPAPLSRQQLLSLGHHITSALRESEECAIPNVLGHLDMNPGNILACSTRSVFLDWAEAYVGPPFVSFQYLLEHWRRLCGSDSHLEKSLVSSYSRHWTRFASPGEIATAFRVMPLLAAFAFAAGTGRWRNPESVRPETIGYLRSIARRMKREADALEEWRPICVL